jgi:hypothetical protein
MAKFLGLFFLICCAVGCSGMAVNNSTTIGTDARGYATGQYSDSRYGCIYSPSAVQIGGGGGGGGGAGMGLGAAWVGCKTGQVQTEGDPMKFARAVALINYSRRLDKITANDAGGTQEYIFTNRPLKEKSYQPLGSQTE